MSKTTLVIGASENPDRYSNKAIYMLQRFQQPTLAIGNKKGRVLNVDIETEQLDFPNIDTVTMYIGAPRQSAYEDYILKLKPKRIIFNPGAENELFMQKATLQGIKCLEACTLVMLSTGQY